MGISESLEKCGPRAEAAAAATKVRVTTSMNYRAGFAGESRYYGDSGTSPRSRPFFVLTSRNPYRSLHKAT